MVTVKKVEQTLKDNLPSGESLQAFMYALEGFKGHAIGLTEKRLLLLRLGMFLGGVKEQKEIARDQIADVHYEGGGATALEALFVLKTTDGKEYQWKVTRAAGLSGGENFEQAEKLYNALLKK